MKTRKREGEAKKPKITKNTKDNFQDKRPNQRPKTRYDKHNMIEKTKASPPPHRA